MAASTSIDYLRFRVIGVMSQMDELTNYDLSPLANIPLKKLRINATRLHGVCRFQKGVDKWRPDLGPQHVKEVAIHPVSLTEEWQNYAEFLLFHEFLHALGHAAHDRYFRQLEAAWPDENAKSMGENFGQHLRARNAKFAWTCPSCDWQTKRSVKSSGRYVCRTCKIKLKDVPITVDR